jgi:hypothetical protein
MTTLRPLGVGSKILIHGDKVAGFYGEVNGIITVDELRALTGVSQGTPKITGDITWLKFSSNYKTLYVSKVLVQSTTSWDYLHERDLVFGKMVEIDNSVYLLRLIQGSNDNPTSSSGLNGGINNEWVNLMKNAIANWNIYTESDLNIGGYNATWCQEVIDGLTKRLTKGVTGIDANNAPTSDSASGLYSWRPVLELLYEK